MSEPIFQQTSGKQACCPLSATGISVNGVAVMEVTEMQLVRYSKEGRSKFQPWSYPMRTKALPDRYYDGKYPLWMCPQEHCDKASPPCPAMTDMPEYGQTDASSLQGISLRGVKQLSNKEIESSHCARLNGGTVRRNHACL